MPNKTLKIVLVEAEPGAAVKKLSDGVFGIRVVYTFEDGSKAPGHETKRLKRDAVKRLAELPRKPSGLSMEWIDEIPFLIQTFDYPAARGD